MARAGVSDVYSASNDLLEAFLGTPIALSQVYRVTHLLGEQLTTPLLDPADHPPIVPDEIIYASIDGSKPIKLRKIEGIILAQKGVSAFLEPSKPLSLSSQDISLPAPFCIGPKTTTNKEKNTE